MDSELKKTLSCKVLVLNSSSCGWRLNMVTTYQCVGAQGKLRDCKSTQSLSNQHNWVKFFAKVTPDFLLLFILFLVDKYSARGGWLLLFL